jgi:hypothetical protein
MPAKARGSNPVEIAALSAVAHNDICKVGGGFIRPGLFWQFLLGGSMNRTPYFFLFFAMRYTLSNLPLHEIRNTFLI